MLDALRRMLGLETISPEPTLLDHVEIQPPEFVELGGETVRVAVIRLKKIDRARARHGKAFKCAARHIDREVIIVPGEVRIIKANNVPTQRMIRPASAVPDFKPTVASVVLALAPHRGR